jgi:hypothetical protein
MTIALVMALTLTLLGNACLNNNIAMISHLLPLFRLLESLQRFDAETNDENAMDTTFRYVVATSKEVDHQKAISWPQRTFDHVLDS